MWDWNFAISILPDLFRALLVTLQAVAGGMTIAVVLGLVWAMLRRGGSPTVAWIVWVGVEFVRSTPLLVQLFFVYYTIIDYVGGGLSPLVTGILVLGVHYSCYTAEVYRAGLNSIAQGQWNAAKALNLTTWQTYRHVILPQAIPPIMPNLGNYLIAMFKDAPMLSTITVVEVLFQARVIGNESFRYLEPITIVGVMFIVLSLISGLGVSWLKQQWETQPS